MLNEIKNNRYLEQENNGIYNIVSSMLTRSLNISNNYNPNRDIQLKNLISDTQKFIAAEDLLNLIDRISKYDRTVRIVESLPGQYRIGNTSKSVHFYDLRKTLKNLPTYFENTGNNKIKYKNSIELLFNTINSNKYPDIVHSNEILEGLNRLLKTSHEHKCNFGDNLSNFFNVIKNQDELVRALGIMTLGINANLTLKQSLDLVEYINKNSSIDGYVFMSLYDELKGLRTANITGESLYKALIGISGENPYYNMENYRSFTEILYLGFTQTQLSQQEIVDSINQNINDGKCWNESVVETMQNEIIVEKKKEDYFPELNESKLVHGYLPYKKKRSFSDGINDLQELMQNEYEEGAWIYDPAEEVWFSMGGRTTIKLDRITHKFTKYDVSKLSREPKFVHIHPEKNEIMVAPKSEFLKHPEFQKQLSTYFASMPSEADFKCIKDLIESASDNISLSADIVSSIGLIEIEIPNDKNSINYLMTNFKDIKIQALSEFNFEPYLLELRLRGKDYLKEEKKFVGELVRIINTKLPQGFNMKIHSYQE